MGDTNQLAYLRRHVPAVSGPVLEIGSKDHGSTQDYRSLYSGVEYVGVDMEDGKNVDRVADLTRGIGTLSENHFALVICCSVLEHVDRPWVMAENLTRLVRDGGQLYISVPWVWRFHAFPDDYFRFSWRGIMKLFPAFWWCNVFYSTNVDGEFIEVRTDTLDSDTLLRKEIETERGPRRYMPYLMVNMLGIKTGEEDAAT